MSASFSKVLGDFSGLGSNYAKYRPSYSEAVLDAILALVGKPTREIDFVDVGAGTGIWTRQLLTRGVSSIRAVEPNDDMRSWGQKDADTASIEWSQGTGEKTGLAPNSADLLSMASSFHWVDFESGCKEFHRVLREGGRFVALWNPRLIEANPLLVEIEDYLRGLLPDMKRVSSGRSGITDNLFGMLDDSELFEDVLYLEGRHSVIQTPEHYLGVWKSVNDVRVQLGEDKFEQFLAYIESKVSHLDGVEVSYLTRAWTAVKASK